MAWQAKSMRIRYLVERFRKLVGYAVSIKEVEREWAEKTQRFVKAELKRADVTYEELANRLRAMGLQETKVSIASKLSRAGFSASFFLATMKAIGREQVNISDV